MCKCTIWSFPYINTSSVRVCLCWLTPYFKFTFPSPSCVCTCMWASVLFRYEAVVCSQWTCYQKDWWFFSCHFHCVCVCVWYCMCYDFDAIFRSTLVYVGNFFNLYSYADEHCVCTRTISLHAIFIVYKGFGIQPSGLPKCLIFVGRKPKQHCNVHNMHVCMCTMYMYWQEVEESCTKHKNHG